MILLLPPPLFQRQKVSENKILATQNVWKIKLDHHSTIVIEGLPNWGFQRYGCDIISA